MEDYNVLRWTKSAKDCYMRGCICSGVGVVGRLSAPCPIYETYFKGSRQKCQMKSVVLATVRKLGITEDMKKQEVLED